MTTNNPHLLERLVAIQSSLMAHHAGGKGLPSAVTGSERETFLREFLQKVFPSHYRFVSGVITDSEGGLSGQVDIAVEYPFLPSFPMPSSGERLLLAESVAVVIEVKSDLVAQWQDAVSTTREVKKLKRKWKGAISLHGGAMGFHGPSVSTIPCIAVGYRGHQTQGGLEKRIDGTPEESRPDGALVIESGCFCGFEIKATGPLGLYALCVAINSLTISVSSAGTDLLSYVAANAAKD